MNITEGIIAYLVFSSLFTVLTVMVLMANKREEDTGTYGASEGAFPVDRFEGDLNE
jgi:hypothetical protein